MRDTVQLMVERDVSVRMHDGTVLYADIYRPAVLRKSPVISLRAPYNKSFGRLAYLQLDPMRTASQGYTLVIQDTRGRLNAEGEFYREDLFRAVDGMCGLFAHLPLRDVPLLQQAQLAPYYDDWLAHPDNDEYWQRWNTEQKHHRFDRNPNTGYSFAQDATLRPAVQMILHDADHPSRIVLPIISR